ncbi:lipocalin family protein [Spirosoma spitsbergense]|uniref:lipocalin family protein n=1 Tax=Spirosoma spitsbergense TaxID=431554 RepID=UPI000377E947|nr:lipocalin family protein [Spirosoma spitsbergense]
MKYALFFSLLLLFSCSTSNDAVPSDNGLAGIWRLTTYCKPASNSTCTSTTVPAGKNVFVFFGNDGRFNETYENTKPVEYSFLGCGSGNYSIEGNKVRIRALCMSSLDGQLYDILSINASQLVMKPFGTGEYVFVKE